jgi:hypothetical protein
MEKFLAMYKDLSSDNLHLLQNVYSSDIQSIDPAHEISGLDKLTEYFSALYQNVISIDFDFKDVVQQHNLCYLQWDMTFCHKSLAGGRTILVSGTTFLRLNNDHKVYLHRDYFDLGEMLYEHLPLLGRLVTTIKGRLGK